MQCSLKTDNREMQYYSFIITVGLWDRETSSILVLSFPSFVTSGELLNFSEPPLVNKYNNICLTDYDKDEIR